MADELLFDHVAEQRRAIADRLDSLSTEQWSRQSRCDEWTVQEVAGHLTAGWNISLPRFALGLVRARGDFHAANARFGRELGARHAADIVADLRAHATHRFTPPGAGAEAPLTDCLVHAHDMFDPAEVTWEVDPKVVALVLDRAVSRGAARITGGAVAGSCSLEATDADWRHERPGQPVRRGPAYEILLTVFGRLPLETLAAG